MNAIKKISQFLDHSMNRSLANSAHQVVAVGAIALFGLPILYCIWCSELQVPHGDLWLRLVGSILGLGLMLTPYWPAWSQPYQPWYWFLTLLYVFSFFFAYTFFINQISIISAMSVLCSVFLLVLLVDFVSLFILLGLGWSLAFLCYYLVSPNIELGEEHIEMGLIILFVVITWSTINYKKSLLQEQRMAGMAAAAGMIAHELRTPLLGIKSGAQALVTYMPELFAAYHLAKEHGLLTKPIRATRIRQLEGINTRMINEIDYANTIIDMLLIKAGQKNSLQNCRLEPCSMADCIREAIDRYPFRTDSAHNLIHWEGDFLFIGSKLLMEHVLFNLLKNALYAIANAERGVITLWTEQRDKKYNYLCVQDTAKGISAQQLARLFEHFYTTTFMGTGIGLSFCKLVMNRFGGDIWCESQEGIHTTFILSFPRLD
jgi:signal transduction histidine kinase